MKRTAPATRLIAMTAVICVTGLVAVWMLLLGPQLDAAAATRSQADAVRTQNAALQGSLDALRADFEDIDELRAELASLRLQLPDDAQLTELSRELHGAARSAGVTLERVEVSDAVDVATAAAAGAAAAATGAPVVAESTADAAATDPAAVAADGAVAPTAAPATSGVVAPSAPPVAGMLVIPLTTTVSGSVDGVQAYLRAVQGGLTRSLLVTSLGITALEASPGVDGAPAVAPGDIRVAIGVYAYVLPATGTAAVATTLGGG